MTATMSRERCTEAGSRVMVYLEGDASTYQIFSEPAWVGLVRASRLRHVMA